MKIEERMMNLKDVAEYLKTHSDEKTRKILTLPNKNYDVLGVKMKDIRALAKVTGKDTPLAIELYNTNIFEAMMLSPMIIKKEDISKELFTDWVKKASSSNIINQGLSEILIDVPGYQDLLKLWIHETDEDLQYGGFALMSVYFRKESLEKINNNLGIETLNLIKEKINEVNMEIANAMNNTVVMAGLFVPDLVDKAIEVAKEIGYIMPLKKKNQCNIQSALDYIVRYSGDPKFSRVKKVFIKQPVTMSDSYKAVFADFINKIKEEEKREKLESVFEYIEKEFPNLEKRIAWNQPMYTDHGTFIIAFSVAKNHISVAPEAKGIEVFRDEIINSGYDCSVMLFRLPFNKKIDYTLLGRIIKFNIEDKKELTSFWRK